MFEVKIDKKKTHTHTHTHIERLSYYGSAAESATWTDESDNKKLACVCRPIHGNHMEHVVLEKWEKGALEGEYVADRAKRRRHIQYQLP